MLSWQEGAEGSQCRRTFRVKRKESTNCAGGEHDWTEVIKFASLESCNVRCFFLVVPGLVEGAAEEEGGLVQLDWDHPGPLLKSYAPDPKVDQRHLQVKEGGRATYVPKVVGKRSRVSEGKISQSATRGSALRELLLFGRRRSDLPPCQRQLKNTEL